ncbi:single-stranded DNA-binding protein [Enterococcus casseliflavus]|uniref:ERF family protein n=1 Tax=Enterococcus casseliflavus TaxID=37734 RepID=UPI0009BF9B81|nr:ERF family protein [Enterococcus casseliflavus]OQO87209.1 single-stranded DNA-binding protein [Enterococcus casseliflavus]
MKLSESIDEIVKGLVKFRQQLVQPKKDANNPFFKSKYVTLDGVIKAIDDALEGTGITYTQEATSEGNFVSVATYILHESGQYLLFEPLTVPTTKADAQAFGSAETYARRYVLAAAFGVASDIDDDGNDVSGKNAPKNASTTHIQVAKTKIQALADENAMTFEQAQQAAFKYIGLKRKAVDSLSAEEMGQLLNYLNSKK